MLSTNRPTTDLAYRPGLLITKRTLLSIVSDHLSRSRLNDLWIGLARSKHLYGYYGNMKQLNQRYGCFVMTSHRILSFRWYYVFCCPCCRNFISVLHLMFRMFVCH